MKRKIVIILISLLFTLNVFAYSNYVIPGGNNIGIEGYNEGIIVIGFYKINVPKRLVLAHLFFSLYEMSKFSTSRCVNFSHLDIKKSDNLFSSIL